MCQPIATGLEIAVGGGVSAVAVYLSTRLMGSGDFATPFLIMATGYLLSTLIYWKVFRPLEISEAEAREAMAEPATGLATAD